MDNEAKINENSTTTFLLLPLKINIRIKLRTAKVTNPIPK